MQHVGYWKEDELDIAVTETAKAVKRFDRERSKATKKARA
jgi:hypothetical protein